MRKREPVPLGVFHVAGARAVDCRECHCGSGVVINQGGTVNSKEKWGYPLSVLESVINMRANDPGHESFLVDRQLALARIERLEHIALALENLSDVGDVVASKLTFGVVPDGAESFGPMAAFEKMRVEQGAELPMANCDAPGCHEKASQCGTVDGIVRNVCVLHTSMLKQGGTDAK